MTTDYLVRATALDDRVRAFAMDATGVVAELQRRHGLYPVPSAAVGRTAMGALLFAAASLKEPEQILTIEIKGDGPIGRILGGSGEGRERYRDGRGEERDRPAWSHGANQAASAGFARSGRALASRRNSRCRSSTASRFRPKHAIPTSPRRSAPTE